MFSMMYKQIGANIIYLRTLQGLSQVELASKAKITPSYLSKIEHGVYSKNLAFTTLLHIAKALEVDICVLIREK